MPVHSANPATDEVGPYRRMSASQANTYNACPRLWFYQKVYRFKMPQIPVLFVGRAVEEAVCRVLKESPGFIVAKSSADVLPPSPYGEDGSPLPPDEASWPAVDLIPLFPHEQPSSKNDRRGERPVWPAPDGFPHQAFEGHPLASSGAISWCEAWEIARPWFVDPDAPSFTMNAIHPGHWFQGEYDLVYRWSGSPVIVDLKASVGANDRSGDYVEQLKIYAMLWYATHGRQEQVAGLQIWYLGHPSIKTVDVPTVAEMEAVEHEMEHLWEMLKDNEPTLEDCPPQPRPMRGFSAGGVASEAPEESRCERCDWRSICPGGDGTDAQQRPDSVQLPGASQRSTLQPIGGLNPRATVRGELFSVGYLKDGVPLKMTMKQGTNTAHIQVVSTKRSDGSPTVGVAAMRGQAVIVKDAVFTINWKGEIVLKMDPFSELVADEDPDVASSDLFDFQAKHNVGGRVVYTYEKSGVGKTGKPWSRKGLMLMDHTGAFKVEGWADDWNHQYTVLEVGDVVAVVNVGLDAWASEVRADYTRNSRLQILERVDRSAA